MYCPPEEFESDDDYDGFSFGDEEKPMHEPYIVQLTDDEIFENDFFNLISVGELEPVRQFLLKENGPGPLNVKGLLNRQLKNGWSPILYVCKDGHYDLVRFMVENGANVNGQIEGTTPLMAACSNPNDEKRLEIEKIIQFLLESGAVINVSDRFGHTPLIFAAINNHLDAVQRMVDKASLEASDNFGNTALFHAIENNHSDIVKILLENGACTTIPNRNGYLPRQWAEINQLERFDELFPEKVTYTVPVEFTAYNNWMQLAPTAFPECGLPPYIPDVHYLLLGMSMGEFFPNFAENRIGLFDFLQITDERLEEIGIRMPFQRKRILFGLYKFHLKRWRPSVVRMVKKIRKDTLYDYYLILSSHLKHTIVLNASINHLKYYIDDKGLGTITDSMMKDCLRISRDLNDIRTISGEIRYRVQGIARYTKPVPPLLINDRSIEAVHRKNHTVRNFIIKCSSLVAATICLAGVWLFSDRKCLRVR